MRQNIEIKAKSADFLRQKKSAEKISETRVEVLHQEDIFFRANFGRLKLRVFSLNYGELIAYHRADVAAIKPSSYSISPTNSPSLLRQTLALALGEIGVVSKTRFLYKVGQTRIHFDEVKDLGNFIELEYVLKTDEIASDGEKTVQKLMTKLEIAATDLIATAYFDLLK